MNIIVKELNLGDTASVLLQVRDEFTGTDFPDTNFTLHTTWTDELAVLGETNSSNSILMSIINLPKKLTVINTVSSDSTIRPTWNNDFISKDCTIGEYTRLVGSSVAASLHRVVIWVPQTNSTIFGASQEFIRNILHKEAIDNCFGVVFTKQHLGEVTHSNSINKTFVSGCNHLNSIRTCTKSMNTTINLGLKKSLTALLIDVEKYNLSITTTNCDFIMSNCLDSSDTESAHILSIDKQATFDLEAAELSRASTSKQEFFSWLWEGHAWVFTNHTSSIEGLLFHLTVSRVKLP